MSASHVSGTITVGHGVALGGATVQMWDRDLPSLERRRKARPPMLGEAKTDDEGKFEITYTLERFGDGEAASHVRATPEPSADITFRVVDSTGRELKIQSVDALNAKYAGDEVIFNAPADLQVTIVLAPVAQAGSSEYEELTAMMAPVIGDVPLSDLADDDIAFLRNELGLEQQREVEQRIEWLRRSALLAQQTEVPTPAFYAWGRKGLPATVGELAGAPVRTLPTILEKLASRPADTLRGALAAASHENIIPVIDRSVLDGWVRQLQRSDQVLHHVNARLEDEETRASLTGYTITTYDKETGGERRGVDITDLHGGFSFDFYASRGWTGSAPPQPFVFTVVSPQQETLAEGAPTLVRADHAPGEVVAVKVKVAKDPVPSLEEQLKNAQLQAPAAVVAWLKGKGVASFADIRRKGGLRQVADAPVADLAFVRTLDALADLDRVSPSVQVSQVLLEKKYDGVLAIADTPRSEFLAVLAGASTALGPADLVRIHVMATVQTDLLNHILTGMAADAANGVAGLPLANAAGGDA